MSGNVSQRTGTSKSAKKVEVREKYVEVRQNTRTVHKVRCATCVKRAKCIKKCVKSKDIFLYRGLLLLQRFQNNGDFNLT